MKVKTFAPPVHVRAHGKGSLPLGYVSLPKGVAWDQTPLRHVYDAFEPSWHPGTRRIQVALHDAVEAAEAGCLRVTLRVAWWWLRRKLNG